MDNGWAPVGVYWESPPFEPPSDGHSPPALDPASTVRDSLCLSRGGYSSSSQVCRCFVVVTHYTQSFPNCQP